MSFPDDDLRRALNLGASAADTAVPPAEDLVRARSAARARTRRRLRVGLVAASLAVVAGATIVGAIRTNGGSTPAAATGRATTTGPAAVTGTAAVTGPAPGAVVEPVRLVVGQLDAAPYTFGLTPVGWSVQASTPYGVTIAPDDGSTSDDPDNFVGKLVIMFDDNPVDGEQVTTIGRPVWLTTGSGYTTLSMRTTGDEPPGVVRIQYPDDTGWNRDAMIRFLLSVHVGPAARAGVG